MLGFPQKVFHIYVSLPKGNDSCNIKKNQVKLSDRKSYTRISNVNELEVGAECNDVNQWRRS